MVYQVYHELRSFRKRRRTARGPLAETLKRLVETRAIFVHIPKCGGKSVVQDLYGVEEHDYFGHALPIFYRSLVGPSRFNAFLKFAVVRDPVTRCLSGFRFGQRGGFKLERDIRIQQAIGDKSFAEFVQGGLLEELAQEDVVFGPQSAYLVMPDGTLALDRLLRFENFDMEVGAVLQSLGRGGDVSHANAAPSRSEEISVPDDLRAEINRIYRIDHDTVARYGGTVPSWVQTSS